MKFIVSILSMILFSVFLQAQNGQSYPDSLKIALRNAPNDTIRMDIYRGLGFYFQQGKYDTAFYYHQLQLDLAKKLKLKLWEADAYQQIGYTYLVQPNLPAAFESYLEALKIADEPASSKLGWGYSKFSFSKSPEEARLSIIGMTHFEISMLYQASRSQSKEKYHLIEASKIGEKINNKKILSLSNRNLGLIYQINNKTDTAFSYFQKSLFYYQDSPYMNQLGTLYQYLGDYYFNKILYDSAKIYYQKAIDEQIKTHDLANSSFSSLKLGQLYITIGENDSALSISLKALEIAETINAELTIAQACVQIASIYKLQNKPAESLTYLEKGKLISDSLNNDFVNKLIQFQDISFDEKLRLKELEKESIRTKSRTRTFALLGGIGIFLFVALLLYRNNRQKQKANKVLEITLSDLRSTQTQLVQSEKMASLGELTAGIAHEIQNPLNFVNNFSEVNKELVDELQQELKAGKIDDAIEISNDIKANEEKINHHGKRADGIVKGMLQHSRSSSGTKEPTDINALADEYLRLAYHGLRAKDKSFNATMKTDFDASLEKVNVIPQDLGRVILNLITNAFYVVDEKKKSGLENYEPTVSVSTKKINNNVEIKVSDNGNGIPDAVKEKIFQPFFTTKPTGKGTGLGLSLSYDIVKAHGGELKVETKEAEGTEFIILLPV